MSNRFSLRILWQSCGPFHLSAVFLFFFILAAAIFETLGIGMVMPLLGTVMKSTANSGGGTFIMRGLSYFPQDFHLLIVGLVTLVIIVFKAIFITLRTYYSTRFVNKLRSYWSVRILDNYLFTNYTDLLKHKRGELINDMIHEPMYASKALYDMIDFLANCIISGFIVALLITVN